MEKVERKICLDTDVLIEIDKENRFILEKIGSLEGIFYTTSVNFFEIWTGKKKEEILNFLNSFAILNFDARSAKVAGEINRNLIKQGSVIDFRDIFIASICVANEIELMTNNLKHFERLKKFGLKLVE